MEKAKLKIKEIIKPLPLLALSLCIAVLSLPVVSSKASEVDTNTITEYVDTDGDGYIDVDSVYSGCPVTSQTVTDEGIVVTCYDAPQLYADVSSNWYIDNIYICKGYAAYPVAIIEGPFSGAFSVSVPYNADGVGYYVMFYNDFWKDGIIGEHNLEYEFTFVASCSTLGNITCYARPRSTFTNKMSEVSRSENKTDELFSDTYTYNYYHTNSTFFNEMYYSVYISSPSLTVGKHVVDFNCYANLNVTDLDGIDVEVDS